MTAASKVYPTIIQPQRWCRNGLVPDVALLNQMIRAINHTMAYRRKTFANWGNVDNADTGLTGTTTRYVFRCHTGYGASHMGFVIGLGRDDHASATLPRVTITTTIAGGASSSVTVYGGMDDNGTSDSPNEIGEIRTKIAVQANTTYEVGVQTIDYARCVSFLAYEIAPSEIDGGTDYFVELAPGVGQPVIDSVRERVFTALTNLYKRNGAHLYSFLGNGTGTNPSFTGTTWTNIIDGTTTSTGEAAGVYLSDVGGGGPTHAYRLSDGSAPAISAVLAVYGQVTTASNGGEVRFYDNVEGTIATITGITTTLQWHTTTVSLANLDTIAKLVVQARHSTAGHTVRIDGVSLYTYES